MIGVLSAFLYKKKAKKETLFSGNRQKDAVTG